MTVTLTMPRLGETMEEGTVSAWLVAEGESFARGDPLVEFETDKTAVEYPALGSGRLARLLVNPGDLVKLGAPIAEIDLEGGVDWVSAEDAAPAKPDDAAPHPAPSPQPKRAEIGPRATPPARRAARQKSILLDTLRGTGRRGRIELHDVEVTLRSTPGGALAETRSGPADGTPVLMIHGYAGDRVTVQQLGMRLGRAGLSVRAVDLPGHGETRTEAARFDDLVDALASQLLPRHPIHIVAHSLGAAVAVRAAAHTGGVASLTLIAPAGLGLHIDGGFVSGMAAPASAGATGHLLRRLSARANAFPPAMIAQIHATLAKGRLKALAQDIAEGETQKIDVVPELRALAKQFPVRAIVGHRDLILDWRDVLTVSPRIAVHHFPDAGHMPHWDAPDVVRDLLIKELTHV